MEKKRLENIVEYILVAGEGNIIRPPKKSYFCDFPKSKIGKKALEGTKDISTHQTDDRKKFGMPERKGSEMPERKKRRMSRQQAKTNADEVTKNKFQDKISVIDILRKSIFRNVADLNDYHVYFNTLKECCLTDDKEIESIFKDNGFEGIDDYYNQRMEYLKNFSLFNVDWEARRRFEREVMVKIICLSNRTSRIESNIMPELSLK